MLVGEGFDPSLGARPLRRAITRLIENPLSEAILRGHFVGGNTVTVGEKEKRLTFDVKEETEEVAIVGAEES